MRNAYKILIAKNLGGEHLGDLCIDARIFTLWVLDGPSVGVHYSCMSCCHGI